jgi:hypothetical protein
MTSMRKTALAAGALYLLSFISIPTLALYDLVLKDPQFIVGPGSDTAVAWGAILELIVAIAIVGTGVVLYPVLKRQNEGVALGFVAARVIEAGIISVGVISLLSLVTLRQDLGAAAGAGAASLVTIGQSLVTVYDRAFLIGQTLLPALNALLLGYLMYRSRLVPRIIPLLGLIGGPLMLSSVIGTMLGINERISLWSGIALVPIFVWELSLGLYLVFKGFKPSAKLLAEPAGSLSPDGIAAPSPAAA